MSQVTCAISGIQFSTSNMSSLHLAATDGFPHPIFAADKKALHRLYAAHCRNKLEQTDSFLLFLAILHSTGKINWNHPVSISPTCPAAIKLVENNISQLIGVIEKTSTILHPSFDQPSFTVRKENSNLEQLPNYIEAWNRNIKDFYSNLACDRDYEALKKTTDKLSYLILSGTKPEHCANIVADWAAKAGNFPTDKIVLWKDTIKSCFSITKMFNTPLPLLKEIKDYCECNIEVGSIHFHTLSQVLKEGIARHVDYLGGSSLALGYTILPTLTDVAKDNLGKPKIADTYTSEGELKNQAALALLAAKAPDKLPRREDYTTTLEFLKAKTAYRVATASKK